MNLAKESNIPYLVFAGDLNADPNSAPGLRLQEFLEANNLVSHIEEPTRVTSSHASILDQFMSNVPDFIKRTSVEAPVSTNDHCTIGLHLLFRIRKKNASQDLYGTLNTQIGTTSEKLWRMLSLRTALHQMT